MTKRQCQIEEIVRNADEQSIDIHVPAIGGGTLVAVNIHYNPEEECTILTLSDDSSIFVEDLDRVEAAAVLRDLLSLRVRPISEVGPCFQFALQDITLDQITQKLGFSDNVTYMDDPFKVKASWGFQDNKGRKGYIWSYKTGRDTTHWSAAGNRQLLVELFGDKIR